MGQRKSKRISGNKRIQSGRKREREGESIWYRNGENYIIFIYEYVKIIPTILYNYNELKI